MVGRITMHVCVCAAEHTVNFMQLEKLWHEGPNIYGCIIAND